MRRLVSASLSLALCAVVAAGPLARADEPSRVGAPPRLESAKPYCAPEVSQLSRHVCYAIPDGEGMAGRHTLVIYLHGSLAKTPGFFWVQQRAMAMLAKRHHFTALMPTSPSDGGGYVWPTSQAAQAAQEAQEADILAGIKKARGALERAVGHGFDEVFVIGFSSGAYYGSSLALRGALDVDGFIILAGGASWMKDDSTHRRRPIFVGVSAADPQTRDHSRSFAGLLRSRGIPSKAEERDVGHLVDPTFVAHGLAWLRERKLSGP
jgi:predicted esterase